GPSAAAQRADRRDHRASRLLDADPAGPAGRGGVLAPVGTGMDLHAAGHLDGDADHLLRPGGQVPGGAGAAEPGADPVVPRGDPRAAVAGGVASATAVES